MVPRCNYLERSATVGKLLGGQSSAHSQAVRESPYYFRITKTLVLLSSVSVWPETVPVRVKFPRLLTSVTALLLTLQVPASSSDVVLTLPLSSMRMPKANEYVLSAFRLSVADASFAL
jgi:hypothetical protein